MSAQKKQMSDHDRRRIRYTFLIDANRINSRGRLQHMNTLERWCKDKVIRILMPQTAQDEAAHGSRERARKAYGYIMTLTESRPEDEKLLNAIANIWSQTMAVRIANLGGSLEVATDYRRNSELKC
ncbi:MAG: hypothetical protein FD151_2364 [bacterium]|nr:MAG: hypothetical protein FD151_2364 [bacterium]